MGEFPRNQDDLHTKLSGMPEEELLTWLDQLTEVDLAERYHQIARRMIVHARSWLQEIAFDIISVILLR